MSVTAIAIIVFLVIVICVLTYVGMHFQHRADKYYDMWQEAREEASFWQHMAEVALTRWSKEEGIEMMTHVNRSMEDEKHG